MLRRILAALGFLHFDHDDPDDPYACPGQVLQERMQQVLKGPKR